MASSPITVTEIIPHAMSLVRLLLVWLPTASSTELARNLEVQLMIAAAKMAALTVVVAVHHVVASVTLLLVALLLLPARRSTTECGPVREAAHSLEILTTAMTVAMLVVQNLNASEALVSLLLWPKVSAPSVSRVLPISLTRNVANLDATTTGTMIAVTTTGIEDVAMTTTRTTGTTMAIATSTEIQEIPEM